MIMELANILNCLIFTDAEVEKIVSQELPKWKEECDAGGESKLAFSQSVFGDSIKELLLIALAIKYAKRSGKEITIVSNEADVRGTSSVR